MAQVPYTPYPTERPLEGTGAGPIRIDAPQEAFGTGIAKALEGLGREGEQVGNELFARAEAMQQLDNRNAATKAHADFTDYAGNRLEQFRSLEGDNATNAFKTFPSELEAERQRIRNTLPNDQAKRLYDSESRGLYSHTVQSGAMWSASQHRVATDKADDASISSSQNRARLNPDDEPAFNAIMKDIEDTVRSKGETKGWDKATTDNEVFVAQSGAVRNALIEAGRNEPFKAADRLDRLQGKLTDQDYYTVRNQIDSRRQQVGGRMIVGDIRSGRNLEVGNRPVSMVRAKEAIGGYESGNRYDKRGPETKYGRALGRYQVMPAFLPAFLAEAGMKPMTEDQFLRDRGAQDELFEKIFGGYMERFGNFNDAASVWFTGTTVAQARAQRRNDGYHTVDQYLRETNALLGQSISEREGLDIAEGAANRLVPPEKDPNFITFVQSEWRRQTGLDRQLQQQDKTDSINSVLTGLSKLGPHGEYVTSMDDLLADPDVKRAYDKLDAREREAVQKHLTANVTRGYQVTPEKQARFKELIGMLAAPEGQAEFAGMNMLDEHLPNDMLDTLLKKQNALKSGAGEDPRITLTMRDGEVQFKMDSLGITHAKDPASYYQFLGTFQQTLDAVQKLSPAPLARKEIKEIFNDLVAQEVTKGWLQWVTGGRTGGPSLGEPAFKVGPQGEAQQKVWDDLMKVPTFAAADSTEQQKIFAAIMYTKVWKEKKARPEAPAAPAGPAVPVSR